MSTTATRPYAVCSTQPCVPVTLMLDTVYPGDPNGKLDGRPGRRCYDYVDFKTWIKRSPLGTKTGWV